jgi:hypothetical protein
MLHNIFDLLFNNEAYYGQPVSESRLSPYTARGETVTCIVNVGITGHKQYTPVVIALNLQKDFSRHFYLFAANLTTLSIIQTD